ncbi:hypothetical protein FPV67DRAFT_1465383 [Lyophyllum atratum]|nr:hypothetical protein FPV67DRAFT_1465383 [Lyophyllum atratum]
MGSLGSLHHWLLVSLLIFTQGSYMALAQTFSNGQLFTNGLSIINAPAPNTPFRVASTLPISIEVSGNGKLPTPALLPDSGLPTRYDSLEMYLVSYQAQVNITVSAGPELLTRETGTVKHLNWLIPSCIPSGLYNLAFYEASHINEQAYFAITSIPVAITSDASQSSCPTGPGSNALQPQPQPCSPVSQSPFLPGQQITIYTGVPVPHTLSPSVSSLPLTVTETRTASSVTTFLVVSTVTVVMTVRGSTLTTTLTTTATTTVATQQDSSGFFPVNSSHHIDVYSLRGLLSAMSLLVLFAYLFVA